jgi:CRISPR-associated endonuclease/helicase Cas3
VEKSTNTDKDFLDTDKQMTSVYPIILKPIYSCPADELPLGVKLPDGWSLSWHQVATLEALRDPTIDVVFNTAMTGDGKSLASYLEVLSGRVFCNCSLPNQRTCP